MFGTKKEVEKESVAYDVKVSAARATKRDDMVMVDLIVNGVTIKSCVLKEVTVKKDGDVHKKGETVMVLNFPAEKTSDGKYYNRAWFPITKENIDEIARQAKDLLS